MKKVSRDVTIPFLMLSILIVFFNVINITFDVKFLIALSVLIGLLLYWVYSSKEMAILSALLSGNIIFTCLKYELIESLIGLISVGIITAGVCALTYNIVSGDDVSKSGNREGLFIPVSFIAFGGAIYLSNLLFILYTL